MNPYEQILLLEEQLKTKKEYIHKLETQLEAQNSRGAGRKRKISNDDIKMIQHYRKEGCTYAEIAENFGISVGSVHHYCHI
ncbi:MAG: hypothetical protein RR310_06895 [Eubacterium sp.]